MTPQLRYTRHQVPRATMADAIKPEAYYLFKKVSMLGPTYQIRLLAFKAHEEAKKLAIRVPQQCEFKQSLKKLIKDLNGTVVVERV